MSEDSSDLNRRSFLHLGLTAGVLGLPKTGFLNPIGDDLLNLFELPAEESEQAIDIEFLFTRDIEFRQETIYFIVVDRFCDGDPDNNAGSNPEYYDPDRQDWGKYWGGDLQGVIDKLDYLQEMGVTALWLSPLFEQVEGIYYEQTASHGYWAKDFKRIEPRFIGKDEDNSLNRTQKDRNTTFDRLIAELHRRRMKLILDIVCNHSSPNIDGRKGELYDDGRLIADFTIDPEIGGWYHHYGPVTNWQNQWQVQNGELAGLATFNEENIEYRQYIKDAIKQWLDRGVDALRVDTVKHMPIWFWQEFTTDIRNHRPDVFIFGEWIYSRPDKGASVAFANNSGMSILDFGLADAIRFALGQDNPRGFELVDEVLSQDYRYQAATELVTFIDNHDLPRFGSLNSDPQRLYLAIVLLMTSRGIPCVYYGTEQYLHDDTNGGNDPYNRPMMATWDRDTEIYRLVRRFSTLRRLNPALAVGSQQPLLVTPDVYCFERRYRDNICTVALNRGTTPTLLEPFNTNLPEGNHMCLLTRRRYEVYEGRLSDLQLGPGEAIAINYRGKPVIGNVVVRAQLNGIFTQPDERIAIVGDCPELGSWDLDRAYPMEYINPNTWFAEVPFTASAGKLITYKYVLLGKDRPVRENLTARRWVLQESGTVKWRDTWSSGGEW
ncbi:MAG: alpha-amylase family glycosyl hydrolase [Cyanobacteria bacterium J06641_5]